MTLPAYHDLTDTLRAIADEQFGPKSENAADIIEAADTISRLSKQLEQAREYFEDIIGLEVYEAKDIAREALKALSK